MTDFSKSIDPTIWLIKATTFFYGPRLLDTLLAYFECVCSVFMKYHVTFQLKKCEFLTNSPGLSMLATTSLLMATAPPNPNSI